MFGNLQSEKTGADLQQKLDNQSTQYGKTRVHRNESNLNDLDPDIVIQYTLDDCYKTCDERHPKDNWWDNSLRKTCKFFCRQSNESCMSKCGPVAALDDECWKKCKNNNMQYYPPIMDEMDTYDLMSV